MDRLMAAWGKTREKKCQGVPQPLLTSLTTAICSLQKPKLIWPHLLRRKLSGYVLLFGGFPGGSSGKNLPANARNVRCWFNP